ncbi:DUF5703 family protein [Pseudarthrobacter sp. P1]|uniref:DUF5703 family protein n=1 Tax=Pseudarthrobacter sp. P1 TaxID=3418418 RepID=UPI003CE81480
MASASGIRQRDYARQYEYLVLTLTPADSLPLAHQRLREHAEYGKWELERSLLYIGGGRQYWLRRRIFRVERTV